MVQSHRSRGGHLLLNAFCRSSFRRGWLVISGHAASTLPPTALVCLNFCLWQDPWSQRRVAFRLTWTFVAYRTARRCPCKHEFLAVLRLCCNNQTDLSSLLLEYHFRWMLSFRFSSVFFSRAGFQTNQLRCIHGCGLLNGVL